MGETRESLEEELIRLCREIESSIVTINGIVSKREAAAEQQRAVEHVKKRISTAKKVCQALRADPTPLAPSQEEIFNLRWLMYHDHLIRYEQVNIYPDVKIRDSGLTSYHRISLSRTESMIAKIRSQENNTHRKIVLQIPSRNDGHRSRVRTR